MVSSFQIMVEVRLENEGTHLRSDGDIRLGVWWVAKGRPRQGEAAIEDSDNWRAALYLSLYHNLEQ